MEEINNSTNDKFPFIRHIYEWNQRVTHFADTKVSVLQIINTLIISFSATFSLRDLSTYSKIVIIIAVIFSAFSSLMLLMTILPRSSKNAPSGINFYGGILKYSRQGYYSKMAEISIDEIIHDYSESLYTLALIQEKKYYRLKVGLLFSFIAITLVGLAIVLNILFYKN